MLQTGGEGRKEECGRGREEEGGEEEWGKWGDGTCLGRGQIFCGREIGRAHV